MKVERGGHTWQPTLLVHEVYLELLRGKPSRDFIAKDEEAAFLDWWPLDAASANSSFAAIVQAHG